MQSGESTVNARIGTTLVAKYRLDRLLGVGGMGAVFDAVNTWTERRVAVKLMLGGAVHDADDAARFLREARAASRIQHPSVVDILDMGQDPADGSLYIVQEFLAGTDLRHVLDQRGALPAKEALEIVTPVMAALVAAHAKGVVHRDLKPENIFLAKTTTGVVPKLIDFGIARLIEPGADALTRTGAAVGTPLYMSPEQAKGERDVGAQSDVWAMGVVLFECISGCSPFEGPNYNAVLAAIIMGTIPRLDVVAPSVPREIAEVVSRALTRERTKRYRSIQQFLGDLLECPVYQAEPWHQTLRSTHKTALEAQSVRETLDDDLIVTPQMPGSAAPSASFSEGRSWMARDLAATTLGRTAREVGVPSRPSRSWLPGALALALVALGSIVVGVTIAGRRTTGSQIVPTAAAAHPIVARMPVPAAAAAATTSLAPTSLDASTFTPQPAIPAAAIATPSVPALDPSSVGAMPPRSVSPPPIAPNRAPSPRQPTGTVPFIPPWIPPPTHGPARSRGHNRAPVLDQ